MAHLAGMLAILLPLILVSLSHMPYQQLLVVRPTDEIVSAPPWPLLDRYHTTTVSPYHRLSLPC